MTCVQPLGLSLCGEAFPSSNPHTTSSTCNAHSAALAFASRSLYSRNDRLPYGIPHRTRRSIRNSEIAYGIFAEWFCCGNPRSKIAYGIPIDDTIGIWNRFGNSYRDTDSIRNWQSPPQSLLQAIGKVTRAQLAKFPGRHPALPQHQKE